MAIIANKTIWFRPAFVVELDEAPFDKKALLIKITNNAKPSNEGPKCVKPNKTTKGYATAINAKTVINNDFKWTCLIFSCFSYVSAFIFARLDHY